jgi:DNA repair exonuclease SbcCD ATPase subunit
MALPFLVNDIPSFATQRMEAAETYSQMAQAFPPLMQVAGDLIMKAQDVPYADQIAERMKALLPPQIQQMENQDKPVPPEVQAAMQQVQQAMQQVEQHGQLVQQAAQEAQAEKADADKSKMDVQLQLANLKVAEAQLATAEAQFKQLVAETQLKMGEGQQTQELANDRQALEAQIQQVLGAIQEQAAAHQQQSLGVLAQIHAAAQPQVVMSPPRPRIVRMETSRQGGKLVATPVYEDQQQPAPQPAAAPAPVVQ